MMASYSASDTPHWIEKNSFAQVELTSDGVATIWLDEQGEKVNKLSPALIDLFGNMMSELEQNSDVKAVVLMSRKKDFIAGADLDAVLKATEIGQWEPIARQGHAILNRVEQSPKPVVAAMHGAAMGGGLEVALACHYRLASDDKSTVFALPEVQLGLLPGGGGTQRLPALIGIRAALDMMLTGKKIYAAKAKKMGLIDRLVNPYALWTSARKQALALVGKTIHREPPLALPDKLLESNSVSRSIIFEKAMEQVLKTTHGNYPAPLKIIECVQIGTKYGKKAGYEAEIKHFDELVARPVTKQLIRIFFNITDKKKNPYPSSIIRPVHQMGVLGAGFMGAGIAQISAEKDIEVLLKDIELTHLAAAKKALWDTLSAKVAKKALSEIGRDLIFNRITTQTDYANFNELDMVIEAVFENLALKQRIIAELEATTSEHCILATNTSALPLAQIAAQSRRPDRILGMHYFSPVPKMPLLEIVVMPQTADWAIATAFEVGIRQGKTCIVVKDSPGFYTTRILAPMLNEAMLLLEEGVAIETIDQIAQEAGFPVGPLTLMDEVGIDVGAHIMKGDLISLFRQRGGDAFVVSLLPDTLHQAGLSGRKTGQGFYLYRSEKADNKKKIGVNKDIYKYITKRTTNDAPKSKLIRHRLLGMIVNEAARCLEEGIIQSPTDGDIGAVLGLGFPPFTGGPFRYLDNLGVGAFVKRMERLAETIGSRFEPAQILLDYAKEDKKFYR